MSDQDNDNLDENDSSRDAIRKKILESLNSDEDSILKDIIRTASNGVYECCKGIEK